MAKAKVVWVRSLGELRGLPDPIRFRVEFLMNDDRDGRQGLAVRVLVCFQVVFWTWWGSALFAALHDSQHLLILGLMAALATGGFWFMWKQNPLIGAARFAYASRRYLRRAGIAADWVALRRAAETLEQGFEVG